MRGYETDVSHCDGVLFGLVIDDAFGRPIDDALERKASDQLHDVRRVGNTGRKDVHGDWKERDSPKRRWL